MTSSCSVGLDKVSLFFSQEEEQCVCGEDTRHVQKSKLNSHKIKVTREMYGLIS